MVSIGRRFLRALVRRIMPGAPVGAQGASPPVTERDAGGVPFVEQGSSGRSILIVHGGSGDVTSWAGVADRLAPRFRVARFTRHTYRGLAGGMADEVGDLLTVADALPGPLVVVGHSSGAVVVLQAALAAPQRFAGMVLYEPPLAVDEPIGGEALVRARRALDAGHPAQAIRIHLGDIVRMPRAAVAFLTWFPPARAAMTRYAAEQIADDEALESLAVGLDRYAAVAARTLLLTGTKSPDHLRQRTAALAQTLPNVDAIVPLAGQGHSANLRAPAAVTAAIADFVDRLT
jgi:pimeloyl-ACP methyl ester carboxylesterase